jgi:glycosyltransferase involved in cell wall biosynthesis
MKALFVCDHRFSTLPNGQVFSGGRYPYCIWQRYLEVFDSLLVIGRSSMLPNTEASGNLNLSSGPRVEFCFMPPLNSFSRHLFRSTEAKKLLRQGLSAVDAAIIRMQSLNGEIAGELAVRMNKPFAVEMVSCPWDSLWNYGTLQARLYAPISFLKTRKLVRKAPFTLYVTEAFLQRRYPCKAVVEAVSDVALPKVACRNDVSISAGMTSREVSRTHDSKQIFRIGFIGSFRTASKGIHVALRALASVVDDLPPFEFRVIGPGDPEPYRQLAERLGLRQFFADGELPGTEAVLHWLEKLDLYVQPSLQEGLPRALIEAMSQGLPALGSSAGGIPELLAPECLHKPGDWRTLSQHLKNAATNRGWRNDQGARNRERTQAFNDEILQRKRLKFWRDFAKFVSSSVSSDVA